MSSQVKVVASQRSVAIIVNKCKFTKLRVHESGNVVWRCSAKNKSCPTYITTDSKMTTVINESGHHVHEVMTDEQIEMEEIRTNVKRKAIDDITTRPNKIIRSCVAGSESVRQRDVANLRQVVYRRRGDLIKSPKSLEEAIIMLNDRKDFTTSKGERFVHVQGNLVCITCKTNLNLLCDPGTILFGDGTFKCCPKWFYQMYTVHGLVDKHGYLPLAVFFLTGKTHQHYVDMFNMLQRLCLDCGLIFNPLIMTMDFEIAAHNAIRQLFPACELRGCRFHLNQSWFRKINEKPKLRKEYTSLTEGGYWLRSFFGLSYIQPTDVDQVFIELVSSAPSDDETLRMPNEPSEFLKFSDYVYENYVSDDANFPPEMWASGKELEPRTTNAAESFHSHFNAQFYNSHPCVTRVLFVLREIQIETYIKIRSDEVHRPLKAAVSKVAKIRELRESLAKREISLLKFVQKMGQKNKPYLVV